VRAWARHPGPTPITRWQPREALQLAGALGLGCGLRLYAIGRHGLWQDEIGSVFIARDIRLVTDPLTGHAPLYYAVLTQWLRGGDTEGWIRGLSTLLGMTLALLVYVAAREELGTSVAWCAALLVALSPVQVWVSREARPYALMNLCIFVAWWSVRRALRGAGVLAWLLYAIAAAAALYTHYYAVVYLAAIGLCGFVGYRGKLRGPVTAIVLASLCAWIAFLPWYPILAAGQQGLARYAADVHAYSAHSTSPPKTLLYLAARSDPPHVLGAAAESALPGRSFTWLSLVGLAVLLGAVLGAAQSAEERWVSLQWLLMALVPTLLAVLANASVHLFVSTRYVTLTSVFLSVPAALVLRRLASAWRRIAFAALLALAVVAIQPLYARPVSEIREAVHHVDALGAPGDCVGLTSKKAFCYEYYSLRPLPAYDLPGDVPAIRRRVDASLALAARAVQASDVPAIVAHFETCRTTWILYNEDRMWGVDMGGGLVRQGLERAGFRRLERRQFTDTLVEHYAPPSP
jgi:4-amino-4-deoxy-L-arabinose transferase-like glycosyltransferase